MKFSGLEVFEVPVICDDFDYFLISFYVLSTFFQCCDNYQEFFFIDLIVALRWA